MMAAAVRDEPQDGDWKPNRGPQARFLASTASEALYGGAAGGGKSAALIVMPLRWVHHPRFSGLILRRETPQLVELWQEACALYPRAFPGAKADHGKLTWTFPSGARIWFTHVQHEKDIARFDGQAYQLIGFDELTHFTEAMFTRICARLRGPPELPKYARATTNPGGEGHEWVFKRWGPWLNPDATPRAQAGEKLWYLPGGENGTQWCEENSTRTEVADGKETVIRARSRVFIPASLSDNPFIGDEYRAQLAELDAVRRAQLKDGNWLIKPGAGLYFKRGWFKRAEMVPKGARAIRYWDRAATAAEPGKDPDWTVGLRLWELDGIYYIDSIVRMRGTPQEVEATIRATALSDGRSVIVGIEQDPGQAGKFEAEYYVRALSGWTVRTYPVMRDKITRAGPVSSQAEHGNVRIVAEPGTRWLEAFFEELEGFPDANHDDQIDALSGAFAALHKPKPPRGTVKSWGAV